MAAHLPFIFFNSFNTAEADYALHDTMYIIHRYWNDIINIAMYVLMVFLMSWALFEAGLAK